MLLPSKHSFNCNFVSISKQICWENKINFFPIKSLQQSSLPLVSNPFLIPFHISSLFKQHHLRVWCVVHAMEIERAEVKMEWKWQGIQSFIEFYAFCILPLLPRHLYFIPRKINKFTKALCWCHTRLKTKKKRGRDVFKMIEFYDEDDVKIHDKTFHLILLSISFHQGAKLFLTFLILN